MVSAQGGGVSHTSLPAPDALEDSDRRSAFYGPLHDRGLHEQCLLGDTVGTIVDYLLPVAYREYLHPVMLTTA